MKEPTTCLIIVNHNNREELRRCLESVRSTDGLVVVLDNHSSDGSQEMVREGYPEVRLIESEANVGYGPALNRAARSVSSDFVLMANSDVEFRPGGPEAMRRYLEQNPSVGLLGPRLLNPDGTLQRSCFAWPGSLRWAFDNDVAGQFLSFVPGLGKRLLRVWNHDGERAVPWIKDTVVGMRRTAFESVGGFNESFFIYYQDPDLCLRLARKGWDVRFAPVTDVVHYTGATTSKARAAMALELFVSCMRFAQMHYGRWHCCLLLLVWKAIMAVRLLRDRARLLACRDPARRQVLAEDVQVWKRALRWRFRDLGAEKRP